MTPFQIARWLVLLIPACAGFAQTVASNEPTSLLGQRYADSSLGRTRFDSDLGWGTAFGLGVNLPVAESVDLGISYGNDWSTFHHGGTNFRVRNHSFTGGTTVYLPASRVKPFLKGALTHFHQSIYQNRVGGFFAGQPVSSNATIWTITAGTEISAGPVLFTPNVAYQDQFNSYTRGVFYFGLDANYWITRQVATYADLTFSKDDGFETWTYTLGMRFKF
jgi:hypothetical protein